MIVILDYNAGNISSLVNALSTLGREVCLSRDAATVLEADLVIIPGVGAFGDAAERLQDTLLWSVVIERHQLGRPIIGICLGMQLLFESSCELGYHLGLGLLQGKIARLSPTDAHLKVPHMGWNDLQSHSQPLPSYLKAYANQDVYFVHSYYLVETNPDLIMFHANYELMIPAVIDNLYVRNNGGRLIGFQFHPEKSGAMGRQLLESAIEEVLNDAHSST